ncbi:MULTISPECIES: hypothetical protein [Streptomyces]|uniref:7-cyano-7-deazaguanine synthase (Queuosine biosynthesis) n=1 Tax=Streptomyces harbinensis TaxID=1176198 RepID=A0A1I6TAU2_9ACTN|nr:MULTISPECIES: hypothetical protein [Streptomyces]SFS86315.1 hypothetical protein SAMN05444716_104518 [Streptomyces harbinensis]
MTDSGCYLWWRDPLGSPPHDGAWASVDEHAFQRSEQHTTGLHRLPGPVPDWAEDLFRVARAIFIADKYARRHRVQDRWTRRITLSVPVTEHDRWQRPDARTHLATLLQSLTGDLWDLDLRPLKGRHIQPAMTDPGEQRASEVALFSGGLDSLTWAATRAVADDPRPLLLVMFREIGLKSLQDQVYQAVAQRGRPVILLRMDQTPKGDGTRQRLEPSSRTRGLLYAAGAIRAATAHGVATVHIPENGQVALNPPLTAARSAALSTRSVHPGTLHSLNALLTAVGDHDTGVQVVNPWALRTKGEVCAAGLTAGLTSSQLERTLSCGKPPARRKGGRRLANCGLCFPCLVRRSGLLHANGADGTPYEATPWTDVLPFDRLIDWRALERWLRTPYTRTDLLTDTPLPPDADRAAAFDVIMRGREELARLLALISRTG